MIDWLFALDWDLANDSAFTLRKQLRFMANFYHAVAPRYYLPQAERMLNIMFQNMQTPFEVAQRYIALILTILIQCDWRPCYRNINELMQACIKLDDPFETRKATFALQFETAAKDMAKWRKERLAPPHALQSDFDRAAATVMQMMMGGISISSAYIFMPYLDILL